MGFLNNLAILPDGRIVGVGGSESGWLVCRLTIAGELDETFGDGGFAPATFPNGQAYAVAVDPGGTVTVVGRDDRRAAVARYLPTGDLDPNFSVDGKRRVPMGETGTQFSDDVLYSVAITDGGGLVATGDIDVGTVGVVRLDFAGGLVPSFGDGGTLIRQYGGYDIATSILAEAGRIVVGAYADNALTVLAFDGEGTPDASFGGGDGIASIPPGTGTMLGPGLAAHPDGGYVVAGEYAEHADDFDLVAARLDPAGALVPGFGDGGVATAHLPQDDFTEDVAVRPDGTILLGGTREGSAGSKMLAAQLQG